MGSLLTRFLTGRNPINAYTTPYDSPGIGRLTPTAHSGDEDAPHLSGGLPAGPSLSHAARKFALDPKRPERTDTAAAIVLYFLRKINITNTRDEKCLTPAAQEARKRVEAMLTEIAADPRVVNPITEALNNRSFKVRRNAAQLASSLFSVLPEEIARGLKPLFLTMIQDAHPTLRIMGLTALCRYVFPDIADPKDIGREEARAECKKALKDEHAAVRRAVIVMLRSMTHEDHFETWTEMSQDPDTEVAGEAVFSLSFLSDPRVVPFLIDVLQGPRKELRAWAARAFANAPHAEAVDALISAALEQDVSRGSHFIAALKKLADVPQSPVLPALRKRLHEEGIAQLLFRLGEVEPFIESTFLRLLASGGPPDPLDREALRHHRAGETICSYLRIHPDLLENYREKIADLSKNDLLWDVYDLANPPTAGKPQDPVENRDAAEALKDKITEAGEKIRDEISRRLGFEADHYVGTSTGNHGVYGNVLTLQGPSLALGFKMAAELRHEINYDILEEIKIELGDSLEELKERFSLLNFLVHHEIAHVLQDRLEMLHPAPQTNSFPHFDEAMVVHYANEILLDRFAFWAGRKIYVHEGPEGFGENKENAREAASIKAYSILLNLIFRNLDSGVHVLPDETLARFVAVAEEMSQSRWIDEETRQVLVQGSKSMHALAAQKKSSEVISEMDRLISLYRGIFNYRSISSLTVPFSDPSS